MGGRVQAVDRAVVSCVVQVGLDCDLFTSAVSGVPATMRAIEIAKDGDPCLRIAFLICKTANGAGDHVVNCGLIVVGIIPPGTSPIPGHSGGIVHPGNSTGNDAAGNTYGGDGAIRQGRTKAVRRWNRT